MSADLTPDMDPWSAENPDGQDLVMGSPHENTINDKRIEWRDGLKKLDEVLSHLLTFRVLSNNDMEKIENLEKYQSRSVAVDEIVRYVTQGPIWQYHALMRTCSLTGQSHLIAADQRHLYGTVNATAPPYTGPKVNPNPISISYTEKNKLLDRAGPEIQCRLDVTPPLMQHLVRDKVLLYYESRDIQSIQSPSAKCFALLDVIRRSSAKGFLSFCRVLCEEEIGKSEIVSDVFGFDPNRL